MEVGLRPASPEDVDRAVPLIYSSGPDAFDFVFGDATAFLRHAFLDGAGEFGFRNHTVAVVEGEVAGIGAAYSGATSLQFTVAAARQILSHYRLSGVGVIFRGLRTERIIPAPKKGMQYIGHLGVDPGMRGEGVGTRLIELFLDQGREAGHAMAGLDVAVTNPRAEALYERLGFEVTEERESSLSNQFATVANHRRMVLEF